MKREGMLVGGKGEGGLLRSSRGKQFHREAELARLGTVGYFPFISTADQSNPKSALLHPFACFHLLTQSATPGLGSFFIVATPWPIRQTKQKQRSLSPSTLSACHLTKLFSSDYAATVSLKEGCTYASELQQSRAPCSHCSRRMTVIAILCLERSKRRSTQSRTTTMGKRMSR